MARIRLLENDELDEATRGAVTAMEAGGQDTSTLRGLAHAQEFFNSYFQDKTNADVQATMSYFDPNMVTYTDATLRFWSGV